MEKPLPSESSPENQAVDEHVSEPMSSIREDRLAAFYERVNNAAGTEIVDISDDVGALGAFLDIYRDTHPEGKKTADQQIDRIIDHLMGKNFRQIADEVGIKDAKKVEITYDAAAAMIAREAEIIMDSRVDVRKFSPHHLEEIRRYINNKKGQKIFGQPLDENDIAKIIDSFESSKFEWLKRFKPEVQEERRKIVGRQVLVLQRRMQGKDIADIANEMTMTPTNVENDYYRTMKKVRQILHSSPDGPELDDVKDDANEEALIPDSFAILRPKIDDTTEESSIPEILPVPVAKEEKLDSNENERRLSILIDLLSRDGDISSVEADLLKSHLGINDTSAPRQSLIEMCERLRDLRKEKANEDLEMTGYPFTPNETKVFNQLLGNRNDGIDPVSRSQMIDQFSDRLRRGEYIDEERILQEANRFKDFIDRAVIKNLRWIFL